ncbi:uncharacterized protein LOC132953567 [Metopolophium dirhodum]|uniref:uncharacterized protein LOC132953567 n=1 Tax=Metopolophium dirhodum TaxID=44670 RepID=UPI00298FAB66|nr:uncharacterized protein LOC132953567 [Metopolophium dirhodum]
MSCNCSMILKHLRATDSSRSSSPVKKNAKGKRVDSSKRLTIINAYKSKLEADPEKSISTVRQEISKELGIGTTTISKTIMVYNRSKIVISPSRTRVKASALMIFEEFERNVVRRHVHSFWFKRQIPTIDKIYKTVSSDASLPPISKPNLFRLLKDMGFKNNKRGRNSALTENIEIVLWRRRFLGDLRKYQKEGRRLYYLGDTCLDNPTTKAVSSSGKHKCVIVLNIGSEDGFVPGALLCLKSKKKTKNYHNEIDSKIFNNWMESVLPRLKEKCVIIMDNASYNSVKIDEAPTSKTEKADIINWLKDKNETIDEPMVIPQLLEIVKRVKPHHDKYVIDELAKQYDCIILRLPPYHCDLNPIELAWPLVKNYVSMNKTTSKLTDVEQLLIEGVERVTPNIWKNFISQTKVEEDKLWKIDFIVDDALSAKVKTKKTTTIRDTSSGDSSTTSD